MEDINVYSLKMKKPQLFLIHFAGGNCYSFQFLIPFLKDFEVIPLELPGRGKRMEKTFIKDFDSAAQDLYNQISDKLTSASFMIYGHSMGAYLALRVCYMLERTKKFPICLFVSGNPGPGIRENKKRYLMAHNVLIEELRKLGGVPSEVLENEELLEFFLPILKADFEILEKNELENELPVNAPIYAMMGNNEEKVEEISNWSRFTHAIFTFKIFDGGHFFIHDHPQQIAYIMKDCYHSALLLHS
jgi:external thioesterase TEII